MQSTTGETLSLISKHGVLDSWESKNMRNTLLTQPSRLHTSTILKSLFGQKKAKKANTCVRREKKQKRANRKLELWGHMRAKWAGAEWRLNTIGTRATLLNECSMHRQCQLRTQKHAIIFYPKAIWLHHPILPEALNKGFFFTMTSHQTSFLTHITCRSCNNLSIKATGDKHWILVNHSHAHRADARVTEEDVLLNLWCLHGKTWLDSSILVKHIMTWTHVRMRACTHSKNGKNGKKSKPIEVICKLAFTPNTCQRSSVSNY